MESFHWISRNLIYPFNCFNYYKITVQLNLSFNIKHVVFCSYFKFKMLNIQLKLNICMYLHIKPSRETRNVVFAGNIQSINFECSPYTANKTLDTDAMKRES